MGGSLTTVHLKPKGPVASLAHQEVSSYLLFTGVALDAPAASMAGSATCRPSSDAPTSYKVVSTPRVNPSVLTYLPSPGSISLIVPPALPHRAAAGMNITIVVADDLPSA